ncbi:MAG: hypothetical protein JRI23_15415 [Deltaproteobacteria bacterium]|jgi:hypothetical protein|nr:hypothetical protein [Deltaproteobacteria bacterium]MBW2533141.1 hypothetical protein [Deltaproteobacteria bacterium]
MKTSPLVSLLATLVVATALVGCDLDRFKGGRIEQEPVADEKPTKKKGGNPVKDFDSPAPSGTAMSADIQVAKAEAEKLVPKSPSGWQIPAQLSKAPTVAEWNASPRSNIRNADKLGCYGNVVREWVRVSCRTSDGAASPIQDVELIQPAGLPHFYRFVADGVASMTFPVRHEIDAKVKFTWKTFSRLVTIKWVRGAKSPVVYFHGNVPAVAGKKLCSSVCSNGKWYMSAGNCKLAEFRCMGGYACQYPMCRCVARDCVDDF